MITQMRTETELRSRYTSIMLQHLALNGWGTAELARLLDWNKDVVARHRENFTARVTPERYAALLDLFGFMGTVKSGSQSAPRVISRAQRMGYASKVHELVDGGVFTN